MCAFFAFLGMIILVERLLCPRQSVDLTELARNGKLDPTIGREEGVYLLSRVLQRHFSTAPRRDTANYPESVFPSSNLPDPS
jgi:hypothetical protein